MPQFQFSFRTLLLFATFSCVCCALSLHFGVLFIAAPLACATLILLWGFFYNLAPDATKFFTVLGFIAVCLLSLTSMHLLRSRENARRNQNLYNMQQLGRAYQQKADIFPTSQVGQYGFYAEAFGVWQRSLTLEDYP